MKLQNEARDGSIAQTLAKLHQEHQRKGGRCGSGRSGPGPGGRWRGSPDAF
jgi:hypothetical protein